MFCACALSFGEPPNTRTCPVCLGLPGALPVANDEAIHYGLMIGLALGCEIAPRSIFHRKNYFYPDLPKGYQISQYDDPLCGGGGWATCASTASTSRRTPPSSCTRASGRIHGSDASVVDFNRGGTPLAEIVTEPDVHSAEQAASGCGCCARRCAGSASGREHGGGLAALRRQHLHPTGGERRSAPRPS